MVENADKEVRHFVALAIQRPSATFLTHTSPRELHNLHPGIPLMQTTQFSVDQFTTREMALKAAQHWFDNALKYEADNKSPRMVELALERACKLETHALTM